MEVDAKEVPESVILWLDRGAASVHHYTKGFLPNAYKWRATADCHIYTRRDGRIVMRVQKYDRKRSFGRGSEFQPKTENGGSFAHVFAAKEPS